MDPMLLHQRLRAEFERLLDLDGPDRERELAALSMEEASLADLLREMLADDVPTPRVLMALDAGPTAAPSTFPRPFGDYDLLRLIGSGGMGSVFHARQRAPIVRDVAIKILMLSRQSSVLLSRFELERQALCRLDHPNIARILDAGAGAADEPYVVMELVDGQAITRFAERRQLPLERRLELMAQVCRAVQHAHDRGVLHRDLKPSNILVTEVDGVSIPKVIDLGVAKLVATSDSAVPAMTLGGEVLGTPEYMSPEQAGSADVDVRADVYSLGVVLYELVTGCLPIPSLALRRAGSEGLAAVIRTSKVTRPSRQPGALRGVGSELDALVLKAIASERDRRYQSARDLADELDRLLRHEAVGAKGPSRSYAMRKFFKRNQLVTITAGIVLMALLMGLGAALVALREAQRAGREATRQRTAAENERDLARRAQTEAEEFAGYVRTVMWSGDPMVLGPNATMKQALERSADRFLESPPENAVVRARVARALARPLILLGEYERADRALSLGVKGLRALGSESSPYIFTNLCSVLTDQAVIRDHHGKAMEARALRVQAVEAGRKGSGVQELASALVGLANSLNDMGDSEGAEALQRETVSVLESKGADARMLTEARLQLLDTLAQSSKWAQAYELGTSLVAERRALSVPNDEILMEIEVNTGHAASELGELDDAEQLIRSGLERSRKATAQDRGVIWATVHLCRVKAKQGHPSEAADELQQTLAPYLKPESAVRPAAIQYWPLVVEFLVWGDRVDEAKALAATILAETEKLDPVIASMMIKSIAGSLGPRVSVEEHDHFFQLAYDKLKSADSSNHAGLAGFADTAAAEMSKRGDGPSARWKAMAQQERALLRIDPGHG